MRTTSLLLAAGTLFVLGVAGVAQAQGCTSSDPNNMTNTCTAAISGHRPGVHDQFTGLEDAILWPPNHKLHKITISAQNADGDPCDVTINRVCQDEMVDGQGDGNTSPDAANVNNSCMNDLNEACVDLRGERSGTGFADGRFYHVRFTMDDPDCANEMGFDPVTDEALVLVPHDQGTKKVWADQGALFDSLSTSGAMCPMP